MSEGFNNFIFYKEWIGQIRLLACSEDPEDILSFCDGLESYLEGEEPGSMSLMARLVYNQVTAQITRDKENYKEVSDRRSEAGKKGAEAKWNKAKHDEAKDDKAMANNDKQWQTMANDGLKEEEDVEDDVSPDGDNTLSSTALAVDVLPAPQFVSETDPKKLTDRMLEEEFDALWLLYPRKSGKKDALRHYKAARKSGVAYDTIEDGIKQYAQHIRDKHTEEQYIAMGSTWFCGHRWEDKYARHGPKPGSMEWLAEIARGERRV